MSSALDRLRRLHGLGRKSGKSQPSALSSSSEPLKVQPTPSAQLSTLGTGSAHFGIARPLEDVVLGQELVNDEGCCYLVTHAYPLTESRGPRTFHSLLDHSPDLLSPFHPNFNVRADSHFGTAAFIDTETTGLGAGAGVYCFMIGVGCFETFTDPLAPFDSTQLPLANTAPHDSNRETTLASPPTHFVVRQLFMRTPAEELALLVALEQLLSGCTMTVTFNGRTFDLPMMRTRYQQNRHLFSTLAQLPSLLHENEPHLDLLIPSRRLWRRRLESCRLGWLEQQILGLERTADDVPGHLIPHLYNEYVRSGNPEAGQIPSIFYHNREDIASMVTLATQIYEPFHCLNQSDSGTVAHAFGADLSLHGLDWLSLGCCYDSIGHVKQAEFALARALESLGSGQDELAGRIEVYQRLGQLYKRQGEWAQATAIWQEWLSTSTEPDPTPYTELAKYCEWQRSDLEQAEMWTRWALHNLQRLPTRTGPMVQQMRKLEHRLDRIVRKQKTVGSGIDSETQSH